MTRAIAQHIGRFEVANGGTIYGQKTHTAGNRLLVSANLLYAAIFLKFCRSAVCGGPVHPIHGLVSQPVFRLWSGVFKTVVAVLLLIPKTARLGAGLTAVWMTAVILSHIFVLGYGSVLAAKMVLKSNSSTSASTEMRRW